jgi:Flp pilus assembly protein TadG
MMPPSEKVAPQDVRASSPSHIPSGPRAFFGDTPRFNQGTPIPPRLERRGVQELEREKNMVRKPKGGKRQGVAAVEFAVCLPFILVMLVGLWEVGRMVEVQQLLNNSVREGGRQASTASIDAAAVKQYVVNYLKTNGINAVSTSDVTVTNVTTGSAYDNTTVVQMDRLHIAVSIPFDSVRWVMLNKITNVTTLNASAEWYSMRDIPIEVTSTIPTN